MKITLNIDISADELRSILVGALSGAKKSLAEARQQEKVNNNHTKRRIVKIKQEPKPSPVVETSPNLAQELIESKKKPKKVVKRGRGRPRLTPEQKAERQAKKIASPPTTNSSSRKTRRWSVQEIFWLKKQIGGKKRLTSVSADVVADFENTFGYARTEKSIVMKAQDLLGNRDKYKGKKYGKRK